MKVLPGDLDGYEFDSETGFWYNSSGVAFIATDNGDGTVSLVSAQEKKKDI